MLEFFGIGAVDVGTRVIDIGAQDLSKVVNRGFHFAKCLHVGWPHRFFLAEVWFLARKVGNVVLDESKILRNAVDAHRNGAHWGRPADVKYYCDCPRTIKFRILWTKSREEGKHSRGRELTDQ